MLLFQIDDGWQGANSNSFLHKTRPSLRVEGECCHNADGECRSDIYVFFFLQSLLLVVEGQDLDGAGLGWRKNAN